MKITQTCIYLCNKVILIKIQSFFLFLESEKFSDQTYKEGNILLNDASKHFIYGYMVSDIW